jgi:hypothetical protein
MEGWLVGDIFSCELKDFSMENPKHTLSYIKRQAKKIKKERGVNHIEALEIVSKSCGYSNWMHCSRSLNHQKTDNFKIVDESIELSFTDWLKRHSSRNSPLGDLAKDMTNDETWPSYNSLDDYRSYLHNQNACYDAIETLDRAWKTYSTYLRKKKMPDVNKIIVKKTTLEIHDKRRIVFISDSTSIPYDKRTVEKFVPGDKAWVSWNGRKAIPVTVTEVKDERYSLKTERPVKKAGNSYSLFLDEVRSTPELACMNHVTW